MCPLDCWIGYGLQHFRKRTICSYLKSNAALLVTHIEPGEICALRVEIAQSGQIENFAKQLSEERLRFSAQIRLTGCNGYVDFTRERNKEVTDFGISPIACTLSSAPRKAPNTAREQLALATLVGFIDALSAARS